MAAQKNKNVLEKIPQAILGNEGVIAKIGDVLAGRKQQPIPQQPQPQQPVNMSIGQPAPITQPQPTLADRQAAGNEYIQQREQLMAQQGLSQQQAARQISGKTGAQDIMTNQVNANIAQQEAILSKIGQLTPEQQAQTQANIGGVGNSFQSIIPEIAANVVQKAGAGAAVGAIAGAGNPLAIAGGALAGGVAAAFDIVGKLKTEETQKTANTYKDFTTSRTALKAIIIYAKNGGDPIEATRLYNNEIMAINRAEQNLKQLEEREWLSKAKGELIAIQNFREIQGTYDTLLANAIRQNPNANYEFPQEEILTQ
jgi:hypothetical protein